MAGEVWRILTCLIAVPPVGPGFGLLFYALFLYVFWMMGTAMEGYWGTVRYNVYILIAYLSVVLISMITGQPEYHVAVMIENTVLLAFCFVYAEFTFMLWFILPVKAKYIGLLSWIIIVWRTFNGDWTALASVANFFFFFGGDVFAKVRYGDMKMRSHQKAIRERNKVLHTCTTCGVTDKSQPDMEFRYCSKCSGDRCYCMDHILNHEHV